MDYRTRNPFISQWEGSCITEARCVFPGDPPNSLFFTQFQTVDDQTTFLGIHGGVTETEGGGLESCHYLIESQVGSEFRLAFFTGKITWEDFWYHKGWLIELKKKGIMDTIAAVSYVHPLNISDSAKEKIQKYNHISPLQLKYRSLVRGLQGFNRTCEEQRQAERDLQEFVRIYHAHVELKAA